MTTSSSLRVTLVQPALPKYRIPVFAELARRPGIDLTLHYGQVPGVPEACAEGFRAFPDPMPIRRIGGVEVRWQRSHWTCATRRYSDVLLLAWNVHYASLIPALLRARAQGVGTVLWGHGYSKQETGLRRRYRDGVARLAHALLCYNHAAARRLIAGGFDRGRVFVAPNSLDQGPIQSARQYWLERPTQLAAFQARHRLVPAQTILYVSRFVRENRVDLLLKAAAELRLRYPALTIALVGQGEPVASELRSLADALDLGTSVRFLGAIYDEMQLAPWFLSSAAFCYPANIGLSILHAYGYGLPVVTSDRVDAQNPEIEALEPGINGLTYMDTNANDLATALDRLLADDAFREQLGQAAHQTATQRFSVTAMVNGMDNAIRFAARMAEQRRI